MSIVRDEHGHYKKGTDGGPGRPKKAVEERYLRALRNGVKLEDWRQVIAKALEQAKAGDKDARKWLSDYLLGSPKAQVDITSGDMPITLREVVAVIPPDADNA